jgi:hypothetical protein
MRAITFKVMMPKSETGRLLRRLGSERENNITRT